MSDNGIARHRQPERVERDNRGGRRPDDGVASDLAGNVLKPDAVAAAAGDLAVQNPQVAPTETMNQAAPVGQGNAAAVKREVTEADMVGAIGRQQRCATREHQYGRAAHSDQLRALGESQRPGAVDAGRQREWSVDAGRFIDRPLQRVGLVVGCIRPHAVMGDVAPERRCQRCRARGLWRHRQRTGDAGGRNSEDMTAAEIH